MSDVENELRSRVDSFVTELSDLIRRQALAAVEEVLKKGGEVLAAAPAPPPKRGRGRPRKTPAAPAAAAAPAPAPLATPVRRGRGRPRKNPVAAAAAPAAPAAKPIASAKRKLGEKRTPQHLAQIVEQTYNYIKANGGQGVEQIAKALATSTKELTLPIRKLLAEKKIGSKGQKRATRYFPR